MDSLIEHKADRATSSIRTESKMIRLEKTLLLLWFVINIAIGILTVHEYGMSVDEPNNFQYAASTLDAYPSFFGTLYEPAYSSTFDGHGPGFRRDHGATDQSHPGYIPKCLRPGPLAFLIFHYIPIDGLVPIRVDKTLVQQMDSLGNPHPF